MFEKFFSLYDRLGVELKSSGKVMLLENQLLLECQFNLNLIDCLKSDNLEQQSVELLEVIGLMETEMLSFYLPQKIEASTTLKKFVDSEKDSEDISKHDLIQNIILKIKTLKAFSQLSYTNNEKLVKVRFKKRLENVQKKLEKLRNELMSTEMTKQTQLN